MWQNLQWMQWVCVVLATACSAAPDAAIIQAAYDRAEAAGGALHDKDLLVVSAKCHDSGANTFLCEVSFISKSDVAQQLYLDIVAVARTGDGWVLRSGLCRR
jgi:outer membrane cobalamin receptor